MKKVLFAALLLLSLMVSLISSGCSSTYYFNHGRASYDKGDYARAIADYTKVIEVNPRDAKAYYNRGIAWIINRGINTGDYDKAIADYTKAIEINPSDVITYYNRGLAWRLKGNNERADADYQKAIALNPEIGIPK